MKTNGVTLATIERMLAESVKATPELKRLLTGIDFTGFLVAVRLCERAYRARFPDGELFDNVLIGESVAEFRSKE